MKFLATVATSTCALLTTVAAGAQDGATPPSSASAPSAGSGASRGSGGASSPSSSTSTSTPASITACRGNVDPGVDEVDAATATQLVCSELARAGAPGGARYMVSLGRLGSMIILTVTRDGDSPGTIADSREARLRGIEEVSLVAPRIADALVHGTTLKETESVNNLSAEDTRTPATKSAKVHFALGLLGQFPPLDRSASPVPGANLELHAEANPFQIVGNLRFGSGGSPDSGGVGASFVEFSVGGRLFLTDADFSPYFGTGLAWSWLQVNDANALHVSNSGIDAYGELGVEILRTHHAHLAFGVRFDLPFYSLRQGATTNETYSPTTGGYVSTSVPAQSLYYAPLSFELRLTL